MARTAPAKALTIKVLSNRADLVSGGDVLLAVRLPRGLDADKVRVLVGDRQVTEDFRLSGRRLIGLVDGLRVGDNVVRVKAPGYAGQRVVTNHPNGGPVFSGPQLAALPCQAAALDAQCNEPAEYSLLYKSTDPTKPGLQSYDPENPPSDVATTTTDQRRDGAVHRAPRARLPGPRPLHDPDAVPARQALDGVGAAEAVEPQGAHHPRRRLRRVVLPGRRAARRLRRHDPGIPGHRAELHHRARARASR